MSNNDLTAEQEKLTKARKAARVVAVLLIFGGAILVCFGVLTNFFTTILSGVVFLSSSTIAFAVAKTAERKIDKLHHV